MARLLFECEDRDGNRVFFETSDKDAKELAASYEASRQWLIENGFTPVKAREVKLRTKEKVRFDGVHCPKCNGALWDNRTRKQEDPAKSKWPDFSCKDKGSCQWAVWPGQYEIANGDS
jgi:uncharacterized protein with PIN domain